MTSPRDLADDLRVLRHPGTAGRDLEDWLAAERKRDAKKAAKPLSKKDHEAAAVHLLKTSHGAVRALNALFLEHVVEGQPASEAKSVDAALEAGRQWRESKKAQRPTHSNVDAIRRFRSEAYAPGLAETTGADRTRRRRP